MQLTPLDSAVGGDGGERFPLVPGTLVLPPALAAFAAVVAPGSAFDLAVLALTALLAAGMAGCVAVWKEQDWATIAALGGGAALVSAAMTLGLGSMVAFSTYLQDPCSGPCWVW